MLYRVDLMSDDRGGDVPDAGYNRWPPSEVAAQQIARLRQLRRWNRDELAARCRDHGAPESMTAAAIANIETGRRDSTGRRRRALTVDELPVFAAALEVPALTLLYPVGVIQALELLPRHHVETWRAVKWFTGEAPLPGLDWTDPGSAVALFREHDRLEHNWRAYTRALTAEDPAVFEQAIAQRAQVETSIQHLRARIRAAGWHPPLLAPEIADLEQEGDTGGSTESAADPGR